MNKTLNWIKEIDLVTDQFKRSFSSFSEEELNYKLKEETWSIAQIIAHIMVLNNSYFEYFREIQNGNHSLPEIESKEAFARDSGKKMMPFMSRDRLERTNTWDIWQPPTGIIKKSIISDFEESQSEFKKLVASLPVTATFIKYPGHFDLIFKLEDCIDFLLEHEKRHYNQALEINPNVHKI